VTLLVRSGTRHGAHRTALALVEPAAQPAARGRPCCSASAAQAAVRRRPASESTFTHRRQRLPRPAVPARAGGADQAGRRACAWTCTALSSDFDYRRSLARGEVDLVIGNWLEPPGELHLGRLISDEIVCLVGEAPSRSAQPAAAGPKRATSTANMSRRATSHPACGA
jgi:hypothetical protein